MGTPKKVIRLHLVLQLQIADVMVIEIALDSPSA